MDERLMDSLNNWIDEAKRKRMVKGEKKHGPLDLDRDPRNFIQEAVEELIDALNYLEIAMYQGKLPFCKWFSVDRDIRFTIWRLGKEDFRKASGMALEARKGGL